MGSLISGAKVAKVVTKLLGGRAPGVNEIHPQFFRSLDVVWLWWTLAGSASIYLLGPCFYRGGHTPQVSLFRGTGKNTG